MTNTNITSDINIGLVFSPWTSPRGERRIYVNGHNRSKIYYKAGENDSIIWSSAHNDRTGKTSSDYAALKKDEAAMRDEIGPARKAIYPTTSFNEFWEAVQK